MNRSHPHGGRLTRRQFLTTTAATAGLSLAGAGLRPARAQSKIGFAGWAFEPQVVEANVKRFTSQNPDIAVTYYLLLTTGFSEQQMGQFLPSVPEWGIPPFPPATQALQAMNLGSLVLDLSAKQDIVWRGVASAKLKMGTEPKKRQSLLREAVRDLLKKYPPRG